MSGEGPRARKRIFEVAAELAAEVQAAVWAAEPEEAVTLPSVGGASGTSVKNRFHIGTATAEAAIRAAQARLSIAGVTTRPKSHRKGGFCFLSGPALQPPHNPNPPLEQSRQESAQSSVARGSANVPAANVAVARAVVATLAAAGSALAQAALQVSQSEAGEGQPSQSSGSGVVVNADEDADAAGIPEPRRRKQEVDLVSLGHELAAEVIAVLRGGASGVVIAPRKGSTNKKLQQRYKVGSAAADKILAAARATLSAADAVCSVTSTKWPRHHVYFLGSPLSWPPQLPGDDILPVLEKAEVEAVLGSTRVPESLPAAAAGSQGIGIEVSPGVKALRCLLGRPAPCTPAPEEGPEPKRFKKGHHSRDVAGQCLLGTPQVPGWLARVTQFLGPDASSSQSLACTCNRVAIQLRRDVRQVIAELRPQVLALDGLDVWTADQEALMRQEQMAVKVLQALHPLVLKSGAGKSRPTRGQPGAQPEPRFSDPGCGSRSQDVPYGPRSCGTSSSSYISRSSSSSMASMQHREEVLNEAQFDLEKLQVHRIQHKLGSLMESINAATSLRA